MTPLLNAEIVMSHTTSTKALVLALSLPFLFVAFEFGPFSLIMYNCPEYCDDMLEHDAFCRGVELLSLAVV